MEHMTTGRLRTKVTHLQFPLAAGQVIFARIDNYIFISQQSQGILEIGGCQLIERMKLGRSTASRQKKHSFYVVN